MHDSDEIKDILIDTLKMQKQAFRDLRNLFIATIISFTIIIITMIVGFLWYENQFDYEGVSEITKEVVTEGDGASANLIEGDQYNDNAKHNDSRQ